MEYNFSDIEKKWQKAWEEAGVYTVSNESDKLHYYVLDMFPYPSGAGLHVGHPLGYIASDIYSRYKRQKGFNVLHPMGFDSYGLPAEQYAIQTGTHPEKTTFENIDRYIAQLKKIGFCYDWSREVRTCDPAFYKWTQWAFIQMFNSYFDPKTQKAQPISKLIAEFEANDPKWATLSEKEQQERLMNYSIAYLADTKVNWCPALGTVLANDEVSEGLSVRGGHPVEQRVMRQWCLRVSAYAGRLLEGLDRIDWTESLKETQRNWIGRSEGAEMQFMVKKPTPDPSLKGREEEFPMTIFTTRADTVFGVTFMVLAPESEYVAKVVTEEQREEVEAYLARCKNRTERERIADRRVTGVFTGSYAINPLTQGEIPIYISDYVLAGYGTGAIMAVPAHDSRDYAFAKHFNLPIIPLIEGADVSNESFDAKEGKMINSGFLNGMEVKDAIQAMKEYITNTGIGRVKVNYRLRDAIFSRQRYWGEPFPIYYKDGMPYTLPESALPLLLPEVKDFKPTETGEPPLGHATKWAWDEKNQKVVEKNSLSSAPSPRERAGGEVFPLELCTMPGFAGSSAYYLRYMDPHNDQALVDRKVNEYWRQVDLYLGGSEHATGHLIYSRFWNKFLYDLGYVCEDEPFKKLINQGMIQGRSNFVYRYIGEGATGNLYISYNLIDNPEYKDKVQPIHVNVNIVNNDVLDINAFRAWMPEFKNAEFVFADGTSSELTGYTAGAKQYICGWSVEKMSKSMFNVVNPDDVIAKYGADTLRLYEMFLGPLEMSKPWDTNGIDGVHRFLKRLWNMYENIVDEEPTKEELRSLHKLIKKITWDIENFSFNTSIPAFMIAQNELSALKCTKRAILEPVAVLLAPYAPHIAEEMYHRCTSLPFREGSGLGSSFVINAAWPECNEAYLVEDTQKYPVQFNGKVRFTFECPKDTPKDEVERLVLAHEDTARYLNGADPKKIIVVPGRIVNIVM
ncbi:MAG: leucine--tRNA ligase [Paludibacteraceae bacterium]|nr:leucine--tRNA ligase [Paludibacteraceae bacterium]